MPSSGVKLRSRGQPSPLRRGAFVLDLLERIAATPIAQVHRFAGPDGRPLAQVIAEDGRLSMVSLGAGQPALGDRIRVRHPEAASAIHQAFTAARAAGRPFGEALAALGEPLRVLVREVLLDQFADGLAALSEMAPSARVEAVVTPSARSAPTRLTCFAPLDVYWRALPRLAPVVPDAAASSLEVFGDGAARAALVAHGEETGGAPLLLAARGFTPGSVEELTEVAAAAEALAHAPGLLAAGEGAQVMSLAGSGDSLMCVVTPAQIAILSGLDGGRRARLIGHVRGRGAQ